MEIKIKEYLDGFFCLHYAVQHKRKALFKGTVIVLFSVPLKNRVCSTYNDTFDLNLINNMENSSSL